MSLKTIFLGNGINHLGGEVIPWDQLLLELMGENKFSMDSLPNLMTREYLARTASKCDQYWRSGSRGGNTTILTVGVGRIEVSREKFEEALTLAVSNPELDQVGDAHGRTLLTMSAAIRFACVTINPCAPPA